MREGSRVTGWKGGMMELAAPAAREIYK